MSNYRGWEESGFLLLLSPLTSCIISRINLLLLVCLLVILCVTAIQMSPLAPPTFYHKLTAPQSGFIFYPSKALDPDGLSIAFYQKPWDLVKCDVLDALTFSLTGVISRSFADTSIHLITKSSHASFAGDYRPISCCNVIYKLLSKSLAARLQPLLHDLVNPCEGGFPKEGTLLIMS